MKNIERQLLWYKHSEANPETHYWNILSINEPREISLLKQNLKEQLKPIEEERLISEGLIKGQSKLHYEIFCLVTPICELDFSKVYKGKVRYDRRLQPRKSKDGWNDLIEKAYLGKI